MFKRLALVTILAAAAAIVGARPSFAAPINSQSSNNDIFQATCGTQSVWLDHNGFGTAVQVVSVQGDGPLAVGSVLTAISYTFDGEQLPTHGNQTGVWNNGTIVTCTGDGLTTFKTGGAGNPLTFVVISSAH